MGSAGSLVVPGLDLRADEGVVSRLPGLLTWPRSGQGGEVFRNRNVIEAR